jgi:hypothetical protein
MSFLNTWQRSRFIRRVKPKTLKPSQIEDARKLIASEPLRSFLMGLMDDMARGALFLSKEDQNGAKYMTDLLLKEIEQGDAIFRREAKQIKTKNIK